MRKMILAVGGLMLAVGLAGMISEAFAQCPPGTAYRCYQGYNGKVICSCS